jgi:methyl-accepting chemotaxis protein
MSKGHKMKLNNFNVGNKILLGFAIPILLLCAFGLWLQFAMVSVSNNLQHIKNESIIFALLAEDMDKDIVQVQQYLSDVSATRGLDGLDDGFKAAKKNHDDFLTDIERFEQQFSKNKNTAGLEKIIALKASFEAFYQAGVQMAHGYVDGGPAVGNKMMGGFDKASEELQNALQPFIKSQLDDMNLALDAANGHSTNVRSAVLITGIALILITIFVAGLTARSITGPLSQMQATISEVEKNSDFTLKVNVHSSDEVGQTAQTFNHLMAAVSDIIRQTRTSVEGIAEASHNLSQTTKQVTEGSIQQSEATTAAAASAEEISSTMSNMSSRTMESESLANSSREETRQALSITNETMSGMGRTAQAIKESASNVARLSKNSEEISGIITVIKEIADQTNLLALNAAIEAARAGEQGRGFAVVADEVRKLAERTGRSTGEIGELINTIQSEIELTVETMRAADEQVTRSVETARQACNALEKIGTGGEQINERIKEISISIKESDVAIQDIAQQMERVAQMTGGNSAAAETSGNTAKHLDELARKLRMAVEKYKV